MDKFIQLTALNDIKPRVKVKSIFNTRYIVGVIESKDCSLVIILNEDKPIEVKESVLEIYEMINNKDYVCI